MDYNLNDLGSRNFEQLTQSLAVKVVGPKTSVFGDGPDGGREATWRGAAAPMGALAAWDGYGVVQAKYMINPSDPASNLKWLKKTIKAELEDWFKPGSARTEKPDYILFSSNVRLSSVPDYGKDDISKYIATKLESWGASVREVRVWDYWDLASLLDNAQSIRNQYAALTTSGDLISALLSQFSGLEADLARGMSAYVARSIRDERLVNLTQGGAVSDDQVTIGDVFVDLPASLPDQPWLLDELDDNSPGHKSREAEDEEQVLARLVDLQEAPRSGIAAHLINNFNRVLVDSQGPESDLHRAVLVAGPGQGKSTVTQWLAQVYRAEFLRGSPAAKQSDVSTVINKVEARSIVLGLPKVAARRWPFRLILTELADFLSASPSSSLLHFMASKVNHGSSSSYSPEDLHRWMKSYPWLILIDGLDEVPASSNREQVMRVIGDFFIDVATLECDVAAVATTRPQGYGEEFSPKEFRHFELSSLDIDEALEYATALVTVRAGVNSSKAEKVLDRLRRAALEEHTQRLMESPLQVTILTILLEKMGKAPGDRSRLFSQYYSIISQREQEKSGDLSDLIQRFETDIDYLHRRVGFLLQERSARSGETTSSISLGEFDTLIDERFRAQGYEGQELSRLLHQFKSLITDRLVFLAKVQADRIGFDLRSLQEFMAAEWIVNFPEDKVMAQLAAVARPAFWRNVTLFAIGTIFAKREHLRAEVSLLCETLNSESEADRILLPGSDLALDVIKDGSASSMPIYSKSLADKALLLLNRPGHNRALNLLPLMNTELSELLWREMESSVAAPMTTWMNRAVLLAAAGNTANRAEIALNKIVASAATNLQIELVLLAWRTRLPALCLAVQDVVGVVAPERFIESPTVRRGVSRYNNSERDGLPDWVRHLSALIEYPPTVSTTTRRDFNQDRNETAVNGSEFYFAFRFTPLDQNQESWKWLQVWAKDKPLWVAARAGAEFALAPAVASLVQALQSIDLDRMDNRPFPNTPWVLQSCIRHLQIELLNIDEDNQEEDLLAALVSAIRVGKLGDLEEWSAAEARWKTQPWLDSESYEELGLHSDYPLWKGMGSSGVANLGVSFTTRGAKDDDLNKVSYQILGMAKKAGTRNNLAQFAASTLVSHRTITGSHTDELGANFTGELRSALEAATRTADLRESWWCSWLALGGVDSWNGTNVDVLKKMAYSRYLFGSFSDEDALSILNMAAKWDEGRLAMLRLALALNRKSLGNLEPAHIVSIEEDDAAGWSEGIRWATELVWSIDKDLWRGVHDATLENLALRRDAIGGVWFINSLDEVDAQVSVDVLTRGAHVLTNTRPDIAESWLERALEIYSAQNVPFAEQIDYIGDGIGHRG